MKRILSLGAGVQSSAVLLMSCVGELPKLDAAIFADTGWEPREVYKNLVWLESEAEKVGIPIYRVAIDKPYSSGNIKDDALRSTMRQVGEKKRWVSMPYRTKDENGKIGMVRRQCTTEYKIRPIERKMYKLLNHTPKADWPPGVHCEQWFGISFDEIPRMRMAQENWRIFHYPLVDMKMTRRGCLLWVEEHFGRTPPRSACIGCPFRSNVEWRHLRDDSPGEFNDAIAFDNKIRRCSDMHGDVFIHRDAVPLEEADLRTDIDKGQMTLWDNECAGMCGV